MSTFPTNAIPSPFDAICQMEDERAFWSARDLQELLSYTEWRNFEEAIERAKISCQCSGHLPADHFVDVTKLIKTGKGAEREINDYHLTRYACYLTAMNGDPRKPEIASAQTYFAVKTYEAETAQQPTSSQPSQLIEDELFRYIIEWREYICAYLFARGRFRDHTYVIRGYFPWAEEPPQQGKRATLGIMARGYALAQLLEEGIIVESPHLKGAYRLAADTQPLQEQAVKQALVTSYRMEEDYQQQQQIAAPKARKAINSPGTE